ncbi:MAG: hypothetical protein ACR2L2_17745 [Acidobacteriota bacterium]
MVICFNCSPTTKRKLDQLLHSGEFTDYSELIATAIENFAVLDEEVRSAGSIIAGTEDAPKELEIVGGANQQTSRPSLKSTPHQYQCSNVSDRTRTVASIPELFTFGNLTPEPPLQIAPQSNDVFFPGQPVPIDRWIFGQFSKLLPAKASCRALARMYPPPANGFELDKVAPRIAQEAEALGTYLALRDRERRLSRDDAWAVGFPSGEDKADRSRLRYANQFVGAIGRQGTLTGLLIDLKLINLGRNGTKRVFLTRQGWEFAALQNPVLDDASADGKFTAAEVTFLLQRIQENIPVEDFAFRTILSAIRDGHDTPTQLDEICKQYLPPERQNEITKAVVTTQRTGVIARMFDLGLINRNRTGVRVSYALTGLGDRYVGRASALRSET